MWVDASGHAEPTAGVRQDRRGGTGEPAPEGRGPMASQAEGLGTFAAGRLGVVIVGLNGAGKTTTCNLLSGLLPLSSG
jgi:Mg-chelatase subunit ChlI